MNLTVLGSGSRGNGYILSNGREALLLEAGVRGAHYKRALGYDVNKVCGCLVTHEHGDHAAYVGDILDMAVPVYASAGTIGAMRLRGARRPVAVRAGGMIRVGGFDIMAFETRHDAAEPLGFFIRHDETGNMVFATDTYYLPCAFAGLNNIMLECNYSKELLDVNSAKGLVPGVVRNRTLRSHMSYNACVKTLLANDLSKVNNIVLLHLSPSNADPVAFRDGIAAATGKTVHVATPGMTINIDKTPF